MKMNGITDTPTAGTGFVAKDPLRPVITMKLTNIMEAEAKKRKRRPSLSTYNAAAIAQSRFQTLRHAEIKVCCDTVLMPTVLNMRIFPMR
jgi:hypothetical protein